MKIPPALSPPSRSTGVSLVEALVALLVLSVGMLGIAALYVESLRSGRSALMRTQAVNLAADMADRIRANRAAGVSYTKGVDDAGTPNAACASGGTGCNPATMAAHDISVWYSALDSRVNAPSSLPGGRGSIAVDTTTVPTTYTITVSWSETGQAAASSYVMRVRA